ncbi:MAG TPA: vitamin K epoxide reductase family protein [Anaerolineales bacterium]|nr:vitamin K epoxide reductase family protein [Anaerolineales bacterium]
MKKFHILTSIVILIGLIASPVQAQTTSAVVHAVFFYSPNCGHCHYVMENTFPPLFEQYGDQLQIIGIDVTQPDGQTLFLAALQMFGLERSGVPFLVVGNIYLIGSLDIPEQFPVLIETYLAQGGMDWPPIPGLREAMGIPETSAPPTDPEPASTPQTVAPPTAVPNMTLLDDREATWQDKFARDPVGNSAAVVVLALMVAAVIWAVIEFRKQEKKRSKSKAAIKWGWDIPVLCLMGLVVAGYLAYVETAHVTAVCGPVGDCNTVQQSAYARLFGVLPIGVLGVIGYLAIAAAWLVARYAKDNVSNWAAVALLVFSGGGTLFSIYLTYLEPFVIGATCAWCITSAILITIIMLVSLRPAKTALGRVGR